MFLQELIGDIYYFKIIKPEICLKSKTMKLFLILFFCLITCSSWAKIPDKELQKLKQEVDEDYIVVYQDDWGADRLTTTLKLYDNIDLKGDPSFVVTPKEIYEGKDHYIFGDSFGGSCKPECKYKFVPIDFVRIYYRNLALAVKDFKNGIARVEHNKKSYYFKFNMNWTEVYEWRSYKNKKNIKKQLEQDPTYLVFIEELKKCILKKEMKCLEPLLSDMHFNLNEVEIGAKKRVVYENVELCKKFKEIRRKTSMGPEDVPDEILKSITDISFVFEKLSFALNLESNDIVTDLEKSSFGKNTSFNMHKKLDKEVCQEWLDFRFGFASENHSWKIVDFSFFAFVD